MIRFLLLNVGLAMLVGCGATEPPRENCVAAPPAQGCHARITLSCPVPSPSPAGCGAVATDTGTNIGQEWCCEPVQAPTSQDCSGFDACRASIGSSITCIAGNCSCVPQTHPGENTPVSCRFDD